MRLRLTKLFHKGTQNWTTQRGVIHPQLTLTSKPKLFVVWWHSAEVNLLCWSGFVKWGILSRLISPLYVHLNCGCHGSDRRRPSTQETTRRSSFQRESGAFFFFFLLMFHRTSSRRCVQAQNDAEHFGGNTLCITFGSFSLLRLISSLYYTALDILLLKKAP